MEKKKAENSIIYKGESGSKYSSENQEWSPNSLIKKIKLIVIKWL